MTNTSTVVLPACQRCKSAKRRCDHGHPKCLHCSKANTACIIVDPVTSKRYAREYIGNLQAEERFLVARCSESGSLPERLADGMPRITPDRTPRGPGSSESLQTANEFVGDSSGLKYDCFNAD